MTEFGNLLPQFHNLGQEIINVIDIRVTRGGTGDEHATGIFYRREFLLGEAEQQRQARENAGCEKNDRAAPFKAHHRELFASWFTHLAELGDDEAGLVNCAAGKDRTGILCALTHHILGVSEEDIRADYVLTNVAVNVDGRLGEIAEMFNAHIGKAYEPEVFRPFIGVRLPYLETAFATIVGEVGSLDAYLTETLGVTGAQQDTIRDKLLVG